MSLAFCEPLEQRRMFITYQVDGTSGDDTIQLTISGNSILSVVNGNSDSASDIINNSVEINCFGGNDTVSIIKTGDNSVTVNGSGGNDTIFAGASNHNLDFMNGELTINGDSGIDTFSLLDQDSAANANFTITGDTITHDFVPQMVFHTENLSINSSTGANDFRFSGPPTASVTIFGNGNASVDDRIVLAGQSNESATYFPSGTTPGSGQLSFNSRTIDFSTCEEILTTSVPTVTVTTPNADDVLSLSQTISATHIIFSGSSGGVTLTPLEGITVDTLTLQAATNDAGAGNDSFTIGGSIQCNTALRIDAGTGTNIANFNSSFSSVTTSLGSQLGNNLALAINNSATLQFTSAQFLDRLTLNGGFATFSGSGSVLSTDSLFITPVDGTLTFAAGQTATANSFTTQANALLTKFGAGSLTIGGGQTHASGAKLDVITGSCTLNSDPGSSSSANLAVFVDVAATVNFGSTAHLAALNASAGTANVLANGNRLLVLDSLSVGTQGGRLNLNDNNLVVDYTAASPLNDVVTKINSGRNNGAWNGSGITSTSAQAAPHNTTLGVLEGFEFDSIRGVTVPFEGEPVDNTAVLVKYTYYGDTDFDGEITFDDYVRIDNGFNNHRTGWLNGDFDLNGEVDFDDYVFIDFSFNSQAAPL